MEVTEVMDVKGWVVASKTSTYDTTEFVPKTVDRCIISSILNSRIGPTSVE
jgi:hypothetical protein